VAPGDPGALAEALARIMAMPTAARRSMGEAGYLHVAERFGMDAVVARWDSLYRELLGGRGR
jgi:glycosyltransferase involved in cell wall biosynthesis